MMPLPADGQLDDQATAESAPGAAEIRESRYPREEPDGRCGYGPVCCF